MDREPPVPPELWEQSPPHIQAPLWAVLEGYERRRSALEAAVRELKEQLGRSAQHSSQPPSTERPHGTRQPPRPPWGRTRGGPPGHPGQQRAGLPRAAGDDGVVRQPPYCRRCGEAVPGREAEPLRQQGIAVPPPVPPGTADP
jgi:transposase